MSERITAEERAHLVKRYPHFVAASGVISVAIEQIGREGSDIDSALAELDRHLAAIFADHRADWPEVLDSVATIRRNHAAIAVNRENILDLLTVLERSVERAGMIRLRDVDIANRKKSEN